MRPSVLPALPAAGVSLLAFITYLFTLAPSVSFIDAGELAAVAHIQGVAHPTGYPLFTILAGLWSLLPVGSGILRLNVLSALWCALSAGVLTLVIHHLLSLPESLPSRMKTAKGRKVTPTPALDPALRLGIAVGGGAMIAFSETFWSTAVSIEVYSLHVLLISLVLLFFVRAIFPIDGTLQADRRFMVFAFMLGLSFTNHMTTILVLPACAVLYFWTQGIGPRSRRILLKSFPAFLVGLLPYLYLPLRAASSPALNWGNPSSWERLLWHVSGKQYRVWIFSSGEAAERQFSYFTSTFAPEFGYIGLVLLLLGLVYALFRYRRQAVFFALLFVGCVLYAINYDIHDIDSYFLLAYLATGVFASYGLVFMTTRMISGGKAIRFGVIGLTVGLVFGVSLGGVSQSGNYLVEDYTKNMFHSLQPKALVVSFQWDYWVSAACYYQLVEGLRPDVTVIDKELLRRSWYLDQIQRTHPDVYARSRQEFENFRIELRKFENEEPYEYQVIEGRYQALINSLFERNYADRPVYVTVEMESSFAPGLTRVPEGLAMRLYRPEDVPSPDTPVWDAFTYRPFHRKERLIEGIHSMYAVMLRNRGAYLFSHQRYEAADAYFRRALVFTPGDRDILLWIEKNRAAMSITEKAAFHPNSWPLGTS